MTSPDIPSPGFARETNYVIQSQSQCQSEDPYANPLISARSEFHSRDVTTHEKVGFNLTHQNKCV